MRLPSRLHIIGLSMVCSTPGVSREPTQLEQYYLELVNRSRANPSGEVTRLSGAVWGDDGNPATPDLNEGLAPGTISENSKPPLAFDARLIDAASDYSDLLLAAEQFSHTWSGDVFSRAISAGYPFNPPSSAGENLAITASSGLHPIDTARVEEHHSGLFIDGNVEGRGHRLGLLNADFREVGIAIRADSDGESFFDLDGIPGPDSMNDVLSTQNFATSEGRMFVTGVIYRDHNANAFYEPGESAGVLELIVKATDDTIMATGTSFGSGGYSINLHGVPAGSYKLVVRDALDFEDSVDFFWTALENVKVDLRDPDLFATPVLVNPTDSPTGKPFQPDGRIGLTATSLTGNDSYSDLPLAQMRKRIARTRSRLMWHARIENDGIETDFITVTGSRSSALFRVTYLRQVCGCGSFVNATSQLSLGRTTTFPSGIAEVYRVSVTPNRSAAGKRRGYQFGLRGVSNNDRSKVDRVNGQVVNRIR